MFGGKQARVWLVRDGDRVYLDRNCDGDLTNDGDPIELPPRVGQRGENCEVDLGAVTVAGAIAKTSIVFLANSEDLSLLASAPGSPAQSAGYAATTVSLAFADRPADAPLAYSQGPVSLMPVMPAVVNFASPWRLPASARVRRSSRTSAMCRQRAPSRRIPLPPSWAGGKAIERKATLSERC